MGCSLPGSSVHGNSPGKNIRVGCHALLQGIFPTHGSKQGLLHGRWILYCWAKNTGVSSLPLLQQIFPIQESNWGLLHCRCILYQLSYQGSPCYIYAAAAAAKSLQSCPTLCDPIDGSRPVSPVPGILRQEHWNGLPFPSPMHENEKWKWSRSAMFDSATPWTAAYQAPPSMGFSRREYWSGVPSPFPVERAGIANNCYGQDPRM